MFGMAWIGSVMGQMGYMAAVPRLISGVDVINRLFSLKA